MQRSPCQELPHCHKWTSPLVSAILVDPRSVEAFADGIYGLWTDENLRCTLVELGRKRLASYTPDDYRRQLIDILEEAKTRIRLQKPGSAR